MTYGRHVELAHGKQIKNFDQNKSLVLAYKMASPNCVVDGRVIITPHDSRIYRRCPAAYL